MSVSLKLTWDATVDVAYLTLRPTGPADVLGPTLLLEHDRAFAGAVALDFGCSTVEPSASSSRWPAPACRPSSSPRPSAPMRRACRTASKRASCAGHVATSHWGARADAIRRSDASIEHGVDDAPGAIMTPGSDDRLEHLLHRLLGPDAQFRLGQREAIETIAVDGARALVVQRTGWGKSLVYWIGTRMRRDAGHGPTLLISPLLSLMRNQIASATSVVSATTGRTDSRRM